MEKRDYSRVWLEREKRRRKKGPGNPEAKKVAQPEKKVWGRRVYLFGSLVWRPDFLWPARISTCSSKAGG